MDVIDRYLRTLRFFLPKDQRDDIIRELSEELDAQVAAQEAALGRELAPAERAAIVGQYGHPLLTAARYWPQRSLIGPVVFPYYWIALRLAVALVVIGHAIGAGFLLADDVPTAPFGALVENLIGNILKVAAWITAIGAVADAGLVRSGLLERWTPRTDGGSMPGRHARSVITEALSKVPDVRRGPSIAESRAAGRGEPSAARLVVGLVIGAWWLAGLRFPMLLFGPGAGDLSWGPAMDRLFPLLVVSQLTLFAEALARYFRPHGSGLRAIRAVWIAGGLVLIYLVATSDHQWLIWQNDAAARGNAIILHVSGRAVSLSAFVNAIFSGLFLGVAALSGWSLLRALVRGFRGPLKLLHA
jgi:hypothetical protein